MKSVGRKAFLGLQLLVFTHDLRDMGTISAFRRSADGIITFVTETGEYSFYDVFPKERKQLANGDWKFLGDSPRWAYVRRS